MLGIRIAGNLPVETDLKLANMLVLEDRKKPISSRDEMKLMWKPDDLLLGAPV